MEVLEEPGADEVKLLMHCLAVHHGLSAKQISNAILCSTASVAKWKTGKIPSLKNWYRLLKLEASKL